MRCELVAEVNPDDDSIDRWVLWHYRYDLDRRQRRNVVIAAFDNAEELTRKADEDPWRFEISSDEASRIGART